MKIKKFTAPTLPEALSKIRQDLGEDAVILKTRFNSGAGHRKGEKSVEVTAAVDPANPGQAPQRPAPVVQEPRVKNRLEPEIVPPTAKKVAPKVETRQTPSEILHDIKDDIAAVRHDFENLTSQSLFGQPSGAQIEIARLLVERNIPESLAVRVAKSIRQSSGLNIDQARIWDDVRNTLIDLLSPGEPIRLLDTGATVVFLAGPTGAGKTSAAARLAFHYSIENGIPVTLVSTDTFRADSKEQLKSLAGVIGCPFIPISSPEEMAVALRSYKKGLLIVDTSGLCNDKDVAELLPYIGAANPHEIHLVTSADTPAADIKRFIGGQFDLKINKLLVTKLDQSRNRGGALAVAVDCGLKFSYQSASREIPGLFCAFAPQTYVDGLIADQAAPKNEQENAIEVVGW